MKNSLKVLIAASLFANAVHADSQTVTTNRTFMATRALGIFDLARQYTGTWNMIHKKKEKGKFGGFFNITALYNQTTGSERIGRYFGMEDNAAFIVGDCGIGTQCQSPIDRSQLIQRSAGGGTLESEFTWQFEKKRWGVVFDYYQDLGCLYKGMYMYVNLPVIHEKLEACIDVCSEVTQEICTNACNTTCLPDTVGGLTEVGVIDYFDGTIAQQCETTCYDGSTFLGEKQCPLSRAMVDPCCNVGKTGVGDMDLIFGLDYLRGDDYNLGFNFGMVIPTSNKSHGCRVWEPMIGNGSAFGLGAGFVSSFTPWKREDQALEIHAVLKYRYFFRHHEVRTLGLKQKVWGQYQMVGVLNTTGVQPLANISTFEVEVARQNHVSTLIGGSYSNGGFTFDLGYELYAKQHDSVHIGDCCPDCICNGLVGLAGWDYNSCADFTLADIATCDTLIHCRGPRAGNDAYSFGSPLDCCDLDAISAETGPQLTHKIYAGAAYGVRKWEYPVLVRLGGYYEFAGSHASNGSWSIYGGAGFSF